MYKQHGLHSGYDSCLLAAGTLESVGKDRLMDEEKWDRYEQERKIIQPETQVQLELLTATLATGTVDETVQLLLRSRSLWLDIVGWSSRCRWIGSFLIRKR